MLSRDSAIRDILYLHCVIFPTQIQSLQGQSLRTTSHGITHILYYNTQYTEVPRYELVFSSRFLEKDPNVQITN